MDTSIIIIIVCTIFNIFYFIFMLSKWAKIQKELDFSILKIRENIANDFLKIVEQRKEGNEIILKSNQKAKEETKHRFEAVIEEDEAIINALRKNKNVLSWKFYPEQEEKNE